MTVRFFRKKNKITENNKLSNIRLTTIIAFSGGIITALIGGYFTMKVNDSQFHNADIIRKQDAEIALTNDTLLINKKLNSRLEICILKKYTSLPKLHEDLIDAEFKLISDTNKYRIIFGKKAQQSVVDDSTKIIRYIRDNEGLLDSCSKQSLATFSSDDFATDLRYPLDRKIISESKTLQ